MDWEASGIKNTFDYELVDPFTLEAIGSLEGVTSGKITESYTGSYRIGGSIKVDSKEVIPNGCMIRVWHTAELGSETYRECIGTFYISDRSESQSMGRVETKLSLQSSLYRLGTHLRSSDYAMAKRNGVAWWKTIIETAGGKATVESAVDSTANIGSHTWEAGETWLKEANRVADALSARTTVSPKGRIVLEGYVAPAKRADSFYITNALSGIVHEKSEPCNRVVTYTTLNKKQYVADVKVADSHPWAYRRIGRWATEAVSVTVDSKSTPSQAQKAVDDAAARNLASKSRVVESYEFRCPYLPVKCGDAGTVIYKDGETSLRAHGTIKSRSFNLDTKMIMTIVLGVY